MIRILGLALVPGLVGAAPSRAGGLLGPVGDVSDPATQADRHFHDNQTRAERWPDRAVQAEQASHDSSTRAERGHRASRNN